MSDPTVLLLDLSQIPLVERNKGIKILLKIFENILSNLNDEKYGDLNYNKTKTKFIKSKPCLDLLFCAGFKLSIDQKRLIWKYDNNNLNALNHIKHMIKVNIIDNDKTTFDENTVQFVAGFNFKSIVCLKTLRDTALLPNVRVQHQGVIRNYDDCICGDPLMRTNPCIYSMKSYLNGSVWCDICCKDIRSEDDIYHCLRSKSPVHPNGFDLCEDCYLAPRHKKRCLCGNYLVKVNDSSVLYSKYSKESVICCHICHTKTEKDKIFWHCMKSTVINAKIQCINICDDCIDKYNVKETECNIFTCPSLERLKSSLCINMNVDIQSMLEDYLHLVEHHKSVLQFNYIYLQLGGQCDINSCEKFQRNHRNRVNEKSNQNTEVKFEITKQIQDRIHCHYRHCYDIGHELYPKEQSRVSAMNNSMNNNEDVLVNKQLKATYDILSFRHNLYRDVRRKYNCSVERNKFISRTRAEANVSQNEQKHDIDDDEDEEKKDQMYDTGYLFNYDPKDNLQPNHRKYWKENCYYIGYVPPKYRDLKQELLHNKYATITTPQFDNEVGKAQLHFNSNYCKEYIRKIRRIWWDQKKSRNNPDAPFPEMEVDHILSIMMYCNYDNLQFYFSQTYRKIDTNECKESVIKRHTEFHFLGKYLKEITDIFGEPIAGSYTRPVITQFHHGVSRQLIFPYSDDNSSVLSPLSTSSSFAVAMNFTNQNNGVVMTWTGTQFANYFACQWLSDFANEEEYFFIQVHSSMALKLKDVMVCTSGHTFEHGFYLISVLDQMPHINYDENRSPFIREASKTMIIAFIENELRLRKYKSIDSYYNKIFHQYCIHKNKLEIDWNCILLKYSFLYHLFAVHDHDCLNITLLLELYPNTTNITLKNMWISEYLFSIILNTISKYNMKEIQLHQIINATDIHRLVSLYKIQFETIEWNIKYSTSRYTIDLHSNCYSRK